MDEDRANLRRWIISAAIVALLHGGVLTAMLRWHKAIPAEPFVMDLAPWSGASGPELGTSEPVPAGIERLAASEQAASTSQPSADKTAAEGGDSAGPSAAPRDNGSQARTASRGGASPAQPNGSHGSETVSNPAANNAVATTPPANNRPANIPLPSNPVANNPVANGSTVANPFANSPIDTSVTVQPWLRGRKGVAAIDQKGGSGGIGQKGHIMFRPFNHAGEPPHPGTLNLQGALNPPGSLTLPGVTAARTPGAHVQDRARAAATRQINAIGSAAPGIGARGGSNAAGTVATNAVGIATPGVGGKGGANAGGNVTTNAIGMTVPLPRGAAAAKAADGHGANAPNVPAMTGGERNTGSVALAGPAPSNASAINGHAMIRAGAATGVVGGPARRATSGVLNGADVHPKVP